MADPVLEKKVDRILFILENDDATDKKGLVSRVTSLEERLKDFISQYNNDQSYKKGRNAVISFIFGVLGAGLLKLIGLFF